MLHNSVNKTLIANSYLVRDKKKKTMQDYDVKTKNKLKKSLRECNLGVSDINNTNVAKIKNKYTKTDFLFKQHNDRVKKLKPKSPMARARDRVMKLP